MVSIDQKQIICSAFQGIVQLKMDEGNPESSSGRRSQQEVPTIHYVLIYALEILKLLLFSSLLSLYDCSI